MFMGHFPDYCVSWNGTYAGLVPSLYPLLWYVIQYSISFTSHPSIAYANYWWKVDDCATRTIFVYVCANWIMWN